MKKRSIFLLSMCLVITLSSIFSADNDKNKEIKKDKKEESKFTFVQLCDTQLGFGGYDHDVASFKQAVVQINQLNPDFVVICGDLVNKANEKSFVDFLAIKKTFVIPCHCAPGNHDVLNKPTKKSLEYYRKIIGKDYFSFEHKKHTFVITNSSLWKAPLKGESEKQDAWLKTTLKEAKAKKNPIFVIGHYPLFLKKVNEGNNYFNLPKKKRKELLGLYEANGVVAVLAGHAHKKIIIKHNGIQFVTGEATSKNLGGDKLGFRLWTVDSPSKIEQKFIPLETLSVKKLKKEKK